MSNKRKRDSNTSEESTSTGTTTAGTGAGGASLGLPPPMPLPLPLPLVAGLPLLPVVEGGGGSGVADLAAVAAAAARHDVNPETGLPDMGIGNGSAVTYKHLLKVQPQPPRYPFVNVFFPITVFLVDQKETMKTGLTARLQIDILYENGEPVPDQSILQINNDNAQPRIDGTGSVELQLAIKQVSMNHENRSFFLRFSSDEKTIHGLIMPVTTTLMTVV
jgi:hypothetical protein